MIYTSKLQGTGLIQVLYLNIFLFFYLICLTFFYFHIQNVQGKSSGPGSTHACGYCFWIFRTVLMRSFSSEKYNYQCGH